MHTPATHRDLVTAYLLALAGLPFALSRDAAGRHLALPLPQPAKLARLSR
jgi:hypothetical protein